MNYFSSLLPFTIIFTFTTLISSSQSQPSSLHSLLITIKASLDPQNLVLSSWSTNTTTTESDPCNGSYEGIACNELGQVVNISLQGKGLKGQIPSQIGQLKSLSGLYLHFNQLHGIVPKEIADLTQLSDLYLNVNNLSGTVPPQIGTMSNLQVLQLCYNSFNGGIPTQLGLLKKLNVLALQYNHFTGAIPATLADLTMLKRLDLSFNQLFGSLPLKLADLPLLQVFDIRNNSLSGNIPIALKRLGEGFQYANNPGLCGIGFTLQVCTASHLNQDKPEPFVSGSNILPKKDIPESANIHPNTSEQSRKPQIAIVVVIISLICILAVTGVFTFSWHRRRKQKITSAYNVSDNRLSISTDQVKEVCRRSASPLISLEYSQGWDPLGNKGQSGNGFSQQVFESFMFNLDEVESATQYFSEMNLLGKSSFSAIYRGTLRDGSIVAVKCISKSSCKSDEADFLLGLKLLTSLKHENLVKLRGFCCSKGRGECFLIYDFVPNGNLLQYLDNKVKILQWPVRVSIIIGIAKGIGYLHGRKGSKQGIVHQNISAEKVLINEHEKPFLSDSGLHKLLADDIVFSRLKSSAAMGYLAPEYTNTGRFTEKSDVYAFGMIIFQILSGNRNITQLHRQGAELSRFEEFVDINLHGNFSEFEASKLGKVALLCTHEFAHHRPTMETVMEELNSIIRTS